jgi:uncharacterized protein
MPDPLESQTIIGDSGPLIALSIVGRLELLVQLYRHVLIPRSVWEEVTIHGAGLPGALEVSRAHWLEICDADPQRLLSLSILVDRGEAEAIAMALDTPGSTVLLDDAQARRVAERFGVNRIGTLGILRRAKKAGLIDALLPLVEQLRASGIFMRQSLVDAVLRDVGELP